MMRSRGLSGRRKLGETMDGARDAVIVGAGPAGSGLAATLARAGWDVLVVERRCLPRHKVCGEFLSPEAQGALQAMGLYEAVGALSPAEMHHARVVSPRGLSVRVALPGPAWGVSRLALDHVLAETARRAGADIRMGAVAVSKWRGDDGLFHVEIREGAGGRARAEGADQDVRVVRARAVVLACGRHFARALGGRGELGGGGSRGGAAARNASNARNAHVGIKSHYEGVSARPEVELFFFPGGYAGIAPTEGGGVNLCLLVTRSALARVGGSKEAVLTAAMGWNRALGRRMAGGRPLEGTEVAASPVAIGLPAVPWSDGAPHLGDAAVMLPPFVGNGMASALRSAELCAPPAHQFLSGRLSLSQWEAAYRADWHGEFDRRIRTSRRLGHILSTPVPADACLGIGTLVPSLTAHFVRATRGSR